MEIIQLALRAWQFLFTLLTTALVGNAIAEAISGNPATVNYAIFTSIFCWVVLLFGAVAAIVSSLNIPIVVMVMDILAALFTFAAGTALAAGLRVHSCGNKSYLASNHITNGSHNPAKRCHELQASTAFYWFLFASFLASAVMSFLSSRGSSMTGGMRRGGPSMSKV